MKTRNFGGEGEGASGHGTHRSAKLGICLLLEDHYRKRWQVQQEGLGMPVAFDGVGGDATEVALVGAAVDAGITVENFAPASGLGCSDAVSATGYRGEVAGHKQR